MAVSKISSEDTINKMNRLGRKIVEEVKNMENPSIDIPIRSLSNVIFDPNTKSLSLGDKVSKRHYFNVAHAKPFMQTLLVAAATKGLVKDNLHTSLRDLFYMLKRTLPNSQENTFDDQSESDDIIVDLEVTLDTLREKLHLNADIRGRVVGNVVIEDRGDEINWSKLGSGGWAIPSNVEDVQVKKVKADYILVIEKNAAFERLHEDKFWQSQNCILITTQGQAARGTRRLIQRLSTEYDLPVYIFTDADSYGWYIYSVIKYGSIGLAHVSEKLGTPHAKFIGLTLSDIEEFGLQDFTIKAEDVDLKRAQEMLNYDWFKAPEWQTELKLMLKKKYKAELESLSGKGLKFVTEKYLPKKIKSKDFLP
jgi:DNA topoisomerase-6 subunit A